MDLGLCSFQYFMRLIISAWSLLIAVVDQVDGLEEKSFEDGACGDNFRWRPNFK